MVQGEVCGVILKNDNTRLLAHSKLVQAPPPDQDYTAELYIPLDRLSVNKSKGPYRHTSNPYKAQLLGAWRTKFKSSRSQDDVVLTLFATGPAARLAVWKAEILNLHLRRQRDQREIHHSLPEGHHDLPATQLSSAIIAETSYKRSIGTILHGRLI